MDGKQIDVDGIDTYYVEQGEGPTIVFMHGGSPGMDAWICWMRQFAGLAQDYRVIAFDQIGYGRTAGGPFLPRVERTDHAVGFLKKLGITGACLVGHSEGGYLITRAAILAPETAGRLVIVTSGATSPLLGGDADKEWLATADHSYDYREHSDNADDFVEVNHRIFFTPAADFDAQLPENYHRAVEAGQLATVNEISSSVWSDLDTYYRVQEEHIYPFLDKLTLPIMLLWAAEDGTVPVARGVKLMEMIPHSEMHIFNRARHMVMFDRSEGFNRLLAGWVRP